MRKKHLAAFMAVAMVIQSAVFTMATDITDTGSEGAVAGAEAIEGEAPAEPSSETETEVETEKEEEPETEAPQTEPPTEAPAPPPAEEPETPPSAEEPETSQDEEPETEEEEETPQAETEKKDKKKKKKEKVTELEVEEETESEMETEEEEEQVVIEGFYLDPSQYPAANMGWNTSAIYHYLRTVLGLNHAAACGVLANIQLESSFNPRAVGDSGTSYGICQWHLGMFYALMWYCQANGFDYNTLYGQAQFLRHEFEGGYRATYDYLLNVPDTAQGARDAAYFMCVRFEMPHYMELLGQQRANLAANEFFAKDFGTVSGEEEVLSMLRDENASGTLPETEAEDEDGKPKGKTDPDFYDLELKGLPARAKTAVYGHIEAELESKNVIAVHDNELVYVTEVFGGWAKVVLDESRGYKEGYVLRKYLVPEDGIEYENIPKKYVIRKTRINDPEEETERTTEKTKGNSGEKEKTSRSKDTKSATDGTNAVSTGSSTGNPLPQDTSADSTSWTTVNTTTQDDSGDDNEEEPGTEAPGTGPETEMEWITVNAHVPAIVKPGARKGEKDQEAEVQAEPVATFCPYSAAALTEVFVHSAASLDSHNDSFLHKDEIVTVVGEEEDGWAKVVYERNGTAREGYIKKRYVSFQMADAGGTASSPWVRESM